MIDRKLFLDVFRHQCPSGNKSLQRKAASWIVEKCRQSCSKVKYKFDEAGNVYITTGNAELYPCIVGHLDQVFKLVDRYSVLIHKDYAFAMNDDTGLQAGIGGDDKVSWYIGIEMLKKFDNIKLAFFTDEETGCCGSSQADLDFFKDCCFVIQPDRNHAYNDYINHTNGIQVTSVEFDEAILPIMEKYGYKEAMGTMTDIGQLKEDGMDCCAFNISSAYFRAHTDKEIVSLPHLELTMQVIQDVISSLSYKKWEHVSPKPDWFGYSSSGKGKRGWWNEGWEDDLFDYYNERYGAKEVEEVGESAEVPDVFDVIETAIEACPHEGCAWEQFEEELDGTVFCTKCQKTCWSPKAEEKELWNPKFLA